MRCPFCGAQDTKVIDSRLAGEGDQIRRRRKCTVCKERFTTYETAELNLPRVVKHDGTRAPFDGRKLRAGMVRALEKRPVSTEQLDTAINRITRKLMSGGGARSALAADRGTGDGGVEAPGPGRLCTVCLRLSQVRGR